MEPFSESNNNSSSNNNNVAIKREEEPSAVVFPISENSIQPDEIPSSSMNDGETNISSLPRSSNSTWYWLIPPSESNNNNNNESNGNAVKNEGVATAMEEEDVIPATVGSGEESATANVKREATATAANDRTLTASNMSRHEWLQMIGKTDIEFYRIRVFMNRETVDDPKSRASMMWCLQKGYIASCARVFAKDKIPSSDHAIEYLRQDTATIKEKLVQWGGCNYDKLTPGSQTRYCNTYKLFGLMPKGSIVAMIMPGKLNGGKGWIYFGVVESDQVILRTKDELAKEYFPMHIFDVQEFSTNRLILRKVQWVREGCIRSLPKQVGKQVHWIQECNPTWLVKLKDTNRSIGLKAMKSRNFWNNTEELK